MIHYGSLNSNQTLLDAPKPASTISCQCSSCCGIENQDQDILSDSSISNSATEAISDGNISQEIVDSLLFGSQWVGSEITYSFYENDVFNGDYYGTETATQEVSEEIKVNVRAVLELLETYTDINFVEIEETDSNTFGQLRYLLSEDPAYAYAYFPNSDPRGGDVHLNPTYEHDLGTNGFENGAGEHGFTALIHETLHALGLKHPHEGVPGNDTTLDPNLDNLSNTVLTQDFTGSSPGTPQPFDIAALQQLYGAGEHNQGDDVYVFGDKTDIYTLNGESFFADASRLKQTIWDTGGNDTLDFSGLELQSQGYLFDLNQGGNLIANIQERVRGNETFYNYGTSLAYEVVIENVIGSASNDTIIANSAANIFAGYELGIDSGDDVLINTDGLDTLDLSAYFESEVSQSRVGQDLLVDLGNDGSIVIQNYYAQVASDRLNIQLTENGNNIELNNTNNLPPDQLEEPNSPELETPEASDPELNILTSEDPETEDPGSISTEQVIAEFGQISQFEQGEGNGFTYQAENKASVVSNRFSDLDLTNFEDTPNLLAEIATYNGGDASGLRYQSNSNPNTPNLAIKIEEDQNLDSETYHVNEQISYLAISDSGELTATPYSSTSSNTNPSNLTSNNFEVNILSGEDLNPNNFSSQAEFTV